MKPDEMIRVISAYREGKVIQSRRRQDNQFAERRGPGENVWIDATLPAWNFFDSDYRVKSDPREWEVTLINDQMVAGTIYTSNHIKQERIKVREVIE